MLTSLKFLGIGTRLPNTAMTDVPKPSATEAAIMRLIVERGNKPMYGREMVRAKPDRLKPGTIYVTLGRMEEKGFIDSKKEAKPEDRAGLPRRLYWVLGLGMQALRVYENDRGLSAVREGVAW